ncbi:methylmalonyl Co-A mutase-associated GTPase MeaB [Cytophagaceae bacterium YF14B1]|uniref:Methylmalonyl Co-A mutase-associated GTPase MeaB n=1 Tax=Xanthocytophaga flava TaxID=3048013 RepID=A0AAE3QKS9_9BACT|nr:methylmalonyl Co-A mutase-associated GTPase MeaB [Xanthocytophaga flavus]MDJ1481192.1 methylmalonyl Co-A mutase-associated GTPase MeaB [Xanthocytophaga flavus]
MPPRLSPDTYIQGIRQGDRIILSRAITLIESSLPKDHVLASEVIQGILPYTGNSLRIGITGVPGVGKSTFIEAFGNHITSLGKKLAVLTIDPSSQRSYGSILGDKTRMETLVNQPLAYVRPSPSGSSLGGVARSTRQSILLCEAAGYEVIFIETVGVGQSETTVHSMVDFFLLLMLAGAGDELQGIKRGIMEMADAIAITKADGSNIMAARQARASYQNALHLMPPTESGWIPPVHTCSALTGDGIKELWQMLEEYVNISNQNRFLHKKRQDQNLNWLHETIRQELETTFYQNPSTKQQIPQIEQSISSGEITALSGAQKLLQTYFTHYSTSHRTSEDDL